MKWIVSVFSLLCGLVGGWWLSGNSALDLDGSAELPRLQLDGKPSLAVEFGGEQPALSEESDSDEVSDAWLESLKDLDEFDRNGQIYLRIKDLSAVELSRLLDDLDEAGSSSYWGVRSMVAQRWAALDAEGLLTYIETKDLEAQWGLTHALFREWGRTKPDAALAAASRMTNRQVRRNAFSTIAQAVAEENPRKAVAILASGEYVDIGQASWMMTNVYQRWSSRDLSEARAAVLALKDGPHKAQALAGVLRSSLSNDTEEALEWLDGLPVDSAVHQSRSQVLQQLLNRDFERAQRYVEEKTNPLERRKVLQGLHFHNFAWSKNSDELREMYDWVSTVATGQIYANKTSDLVRSMASVDREQAMTFALSLPAGNPRLNALGALAGEIAQSDPQAALEFIESLEYSDERQRALSHMGWQFANSGVAEAAQLVSQSSDPEIQRQLAQQIANQWSQYDVDTSLEWASSLDDDNARSSATQAVLKNWVQVDPDAAFAYVERSDAEGSKQQGLYQSIFNSWGWEDPEAAAYALDRLPDGEQAQSYRGNIYSQVAGAYVQHDPMGASEWIAGLESGAERDQSVQALVNSISRSDPEAGFIWAATVDDNNVRKNSMRQSLRQWAKSDPDSASRAIRDAELAADEKEKLFKVVENNRPKN